MNSDQFPEYPENKYMIREMPKAMPVTFRLPNGKTGTATIQPQKGTFYEIIFKGDVKQPEEFNQVFTSMPIAEKHLKDWIIREDATIESVDRKYEYWTRSSVQSV